MVTAKDYIRAKTGDESVNIVHYNRESNTHTGYDLEELLNEFLMIKSSDNIIQTLNPRNKTYTVVNKDKGLVIGGFSSKLKGIEVITKRD